MTKRRAENVLPPEIPYKRCLRSRSNIDDKAVGGVTKVQNGNPLPLLSTVGHRCRKRPNYNEDDDPLDTDKLPRKVPTNRVNALPGGEDTCRSGRFEDAEKRVADKAKTNKQPQQKTALNPGDKVVHRDEDLSAFNSFQFWRIPLPELDLSLLDTEPSAGPKAAFPTKDLEAMET